MNILIKDAVPATVLVGGIAISAAFVIVGLMVLLSLAFGYVSKSFGKEDALEGTSSSSSECLDCDRVRIEAIPPDLRKILSRNYIESNKSVMVAEANEIIQARNGLASVTLEKIEASNSDITWLAGYSFNPETQTLFNRLEFAASERVGDDLLQLRGELPFYIEVHSVDGAIGHDWLDERSSIFIRVECNTSSMESLSPIVYQGLAPFWASESAEKCDVFRKSLVDQKARLSQLISRDLIERHGIVAESLPGLSGEPITKYLLDEMRFVNAQDAILNPSVEQRILLWSVVQFGLRDVESTVHMRVTLRVTLEEDFTLLEESAEVLLIEMEKPYRETLS